MGRVVPEFDMPALNELIRTPYHAICWLDHEIFWEHWGKDYYKA